MQKNKKKFLQRLEWQELMNLRLGSQWQWDINSVFPLKITKGQQIGYERKTRRKLQLTLHATK